MEAGTNKEFTALLRIVQTNVSGIYDVDVTDFIGNHACANYPPSLFDDEGHMRATARKSTLVKALEAEIQDLPHLLL